MDISQTRSDSNVPIYEYRCNQCRRKTTVFVRSFSAAVEPACERCGSRDLARLISRFAVVRSEESRLEDLAGPSSLAGLDEDDPRSIAQWARRMGDAAGEDLGPEWDEMVDRMEAGELPDDLDGDGLDDGGWENGGETGHSHALEDGE